MKSLIVFLFVILLFVVVFVRPVRVEKSVFMKREYGYYEANGQFFEYEDLEKMLSEKYILDSMNYARSRFGWYFCWDLKKVEVFGKTVSLSSAVIVLFGLVVAFWIVKLCWRKRCSKKHSVLPEYIKPSHKLMISDKY